MGKDTTLGGCQILCKSKNTWVVRELAAVGPDVGVNTPGLYRWDDRFWVEVLDGTPCRVAALGIRGIQRLGIRPNIPYIVLKTLPALWRDAELVKTLPPFRFNRPC